MKHPKIKILFALAWFTFMVVSRQWLAESLGPSEAKQNIVVTHHATSIRSLPMKYLDDPISTAYVWDLLLFNDKTSFRAAF